MKHRVDELDEENLVYRFSILEGANMGVGFESDSVVIKVEVGPDGEKATPDSQTKDMAEC
ncbi:hypothetical protein SASPL_109502 [Salvia splendens]|uniref:Uncharacterized protein n=1 Tax=Salvia splendens TaxID=180675 RepID=A0A8X8YEZ0_SALSN|nr:hypothetical protein SASPL_109502 [Salvia splendens]